MASWDLIYLSAALARVDHVVLLDGEARKFSGGFDHGHLDHECCSGSSSSWRRASGGGSVAELGGCETVGASTSELRAGGREAMGPLRRRSRSGLWCRRGQRAEGIAMEWQERGGEDCWLAAGR
jgi:hypothetical protein